MLNTEAEKPFPVYAFRGQKPTEIKVFWRRSVGWQNDYQMSAGTGFEMRRINS